MDQANQHENKNDNQSNNKEINVSISEEIAGGVYSNLAVSNLSKEECILDFLFVQPQVNKANVKSRVIMSPGNVKKLAQLLLTNINEYESKFGEISDQFPNSSLNLSVN